MTRAEMIVAILNGWTASFAKGGGKSAKGKAGAKGKKAKGAAQAGSGGACCKTEGGKFAPGNNYGSLAGKGHSQRAAANRVKARLAAKSKVAKAEKAVASASGGPKAGIAGMVARSKSASARAAGVQAAREKSALEKRQARNAKARARRSEKQEAAKQEAAKPARDRAIGAMVAKSKGAVEAKSASAKAPTTASNVADRIAAAKARQKAQVKASMATRVDAAPSGVKPSPAATPAPRASSPASEAARRAAMASHQGGSKATRAVVKRYEDEAKAASRPSKADLERDVVSKDSATRRKAMDAILENRRQVDATAKDRRLQGEADRDVRATGKQLAKAKEKLADAEQADPNRQARGMIAILERQKAAASAKVAALKAQREALGSRPVAPVKPPPASVERRPISDPGRLKAESRKMDEAFEKAPGARDNFVSLADLHRTMPHLSREEFVAVVNRGRDDGKYGLDSHEGLVRPMSAAEREASIVDRSGRLVWISRRDRA